MSTLGLLGVGVPRADLASHKVTVFFANCRKGFEVQRRNSSLGFWGGFKECQVVVGGILPRVPTSCLAFGNAEALLQGRDMGPRSGGIVWGW